MDMDKNKNALSLDGLRSGTELYAWQWDWPQGLARPLSKMKPVRGVLAEWPDRIGDTSRGPGWFVPYSGKSRRPAFTKAVRVEAVQLYMDKADAEDAYAASVRATIGHFLSFAAMAQAELPRLERLGFTENGQLENYPMLVPDLSGDFEDVVRAAQPALVLKEDHEGDLMPWEAFSRLEQSGCINKYDGCADFQLDGFGCKNALVDMCRGLVYIPDRYAVPFEKVPEVFSGHRPEILWFNK